MKSLAGLMNSAAGFGYIIHTAQPIAAPAPVRMAFRHLAEVLASFKMQKIIIQKPYEFIAPHRGNWWPTFIQRFRLIDRWLRKSHGIVQYECRHTNRLRASLDAGHGILLTPNHCRPCDPVVMGFPAREAGTHVFAMASWHLFNQDWFTAQRYVRWAASV